MVLLLSFLELQLCWWHRNKPVYHSSYLPYLIPTPQLATWLRIFKSRSDLFEEICFFFGWIVHHFYSLFSSWLQKCVNGFCCACSFARNLRGEFALFIARKKAVNCGEIFLASIEISSNPNVNVKKRAGSTGYKIEFYKFSEVVQTITIYDYQPSLLIQINTAPYHKHAGHDKEQFCPIHHHWKCFFSKSMYYTQPKCYPIWWLKFFSGSKPLFSGNTLTAVCRYNVAVPYGVLYLVPAGVTCSTFFRIAVPPSPSTRYKYENIMSTTYHTCTCANNQL